MRLAYLAGPIDQAMTSGRDFGLLWQGWRTQIENGLVDRGFDVFRPYRAFKSGSASAAVQTANNAVIDVSQAGVVCLPAGVPTLGTPVEIERMLSRKIPVLIVTDIEGSVQLRQWMDRGAGVMTPDRLYHGLDALGRSVNAVIHRPSPLEAMRMAADQLARTFGPRPLVFESVAGGEAALGLLPTRGYSDDAGLDLYVSRDTEIGPGKFVDVPSGVKVDIPAGHWAMITGRSSTLRKLDLHVSTGVIDAGWTGELFAGVRNMGRETVYLSAGDRVAQLILLPAPVTGLNPEWGRVPVKDRGTRGFGSTGA